MLALALNTAPMSILYGLNDLISARDDKITGEHNSIPSARTLLHVALVLEGLVAHIDIVLECERELSLLEVLGERQTVREPLEVLAVREHARVVLLEQLGKGSLVYGSGPVHVGREFITGAKREAGAFVLTSLWRQCK